VRMRSTSMLAMTALLIVSIGGCTSGHGSPASSGAFTTYRQPPGPMSLTFRYPSGWQATGSTWVSSMGYVGQAQVIGDTSSTLADVTASRNCLQREGLLHGTGVLISWSENLGAPRPIRLATEPGQSVRVNGYPAKLDDITSTGCERRIINGTIQVAPRRFLYMHAEIGSHATPGAVGAVRTIFASAHPQPHTRAMRTYLRRTDVPFFDGRDQQPSRSEPAIVHAMLHDERESESAPIASYKEIACLPRA
jgi:hypothetical protein